MLKQGLSDSSSEDTRFLGLSPTELMNSSCFLIIQKGFLPSGNICILTMPPSRKYYIVIKLYDGVNIAPSNSPSYIAGN